MTVDIKAIPLFYDVMDTLRIYDRYDEHMTAQLAFSRIFEDTGFSFTLNGSFDAVQWEGFGDGETRLETFKRSLERYKCEFRIVGNIIYLEHQIGNDTNHQYRHRLNASNIVQEVDANELWTYAKGYGDYGDGGGGEDWQNAKLKREYTSPNGIIIGIIHAPPIKNGNITTKAQMGSQLKTLVDESLKISITADIHDLTRQNYPIAQSQLGDRVFVIDERIGVDEEVRIVNKSITRNWRGDILDVTLTFGSEGLAKRHQSNLNTALKNVTDWITGRKTIPYSIVDEAIKNATQALKNAQTELKFENGILAIDKQDANKVVLFNSAGVGISSDGGNTFRTAMTGDGIVADVIYAGTLNADMVTIRGGSATEYINITGNELESRGKYTRSWFGDVTTEDTRLRLTRGYFIAESMTSDQRLYYSNRGISTYLSGSDASEGGGSETGYSGSGVIEFFSHRYDPDVRGLTLSSNRGIVALKTYTRDIVLDANRDVNIKSSVGVVNIDPTEQGRLGSNRFQFYIKAGSTSSDTDGVLRFGAPGAGFSSALRFQKTRSGLATIWATNGNGDKGTAEFVALGLVADSLRAYSSDGHMYIGVGTSGSRLRVTNRLLYNDGSTVYRPVEAEGLMTGYTHLYLGASGSNGGEVRATNKLLYNDGNPSYRPVRAREFITDTSLRENKRNIDVYDVDVLEILRKADAYLYNRKNDGSYTKKQLGLMLDELPYETYSERGDGFGMYGLVTFLFRGLKQAVEEIDKLKEGA